MPQFGIYRNPGRNRSIPFLCQFQSSRLDRSRGRVLVALVRRDALAPRITLSRPTSRIQGTDVHMDPLDVATVPARLFANAIEILAEADQDRVARAVDEMLNRA